MHTIPCVLIMNLLHVFIYCMCHYCGDVFFFLQYTVLCCPNVECHYVQLVIGNAERQHVVQPWNLFCRPLLVQPVFFYLDVTWGENNPFLILYFRGTPVRIAREGHDTHSEAAGMLDSDKLFNQCLSQQVLPFGFKPFSFHLDSLLHVFFSFPCFLTVALPLACTAWILLFCYFSCSVT